MADHTDLISVLRGFDGTSREAQGWMDEAADALEAQAREIEALKTALRYQEGQAGHLYTHSSSCWQWGPRHYDCAVREIEALRADAGRYRWQPIESAPNNRTLLVWNKAYGAVTGHVLAGDIWGAYVPGVPMLFQPHLDPAPTHWMLRPEPPAIDAAVSAEQKGAAS